MSAKTIAKTTVILPFHFRHRPRGEGKAPLEGIFNTEQEPSVVTLAREWSRRMIPRTSANHQVEIPDSLSDLAEWTEATHTLDRLDPQRTNPSPAVKAIRKSLFKTLSKSLDELGIQMKDAQAAFSQEVSHRVRFVQPLWGPLNEIDLKTFNHHHPEQFSEQQANIVRKVKDLLNTKEMTSGENKNRLKFTGLETEMVGSGMSASIKRLWCVEGEPEKTELEKGASDENLATDQQSIELGTSPSNVEIDHPLLTHPLLGRCLTLSANESFLNLLSVDARFNVVSNKQSIGIVKLCRILCSFINQQNGFLSLSFKLESGADGETLTLEDVHELIYGLTRSKNQYALQPLSPPSAKNWHLGLLPPELTQQHSFHLSDLGLWLIQFKAEVQNELKNKKRLGDLRRYIHHTSVCLKGDHPLVSKHDDAVDTKLPELKRHCWRLSRAIGNKRFPPYNVGTKQGLGGSQLYENVLVETSVEGTCALTWENQMSEFDFDGWSDTHYHGLYLLLHLHVRGEEAGLQDFSFDSLELIRSLRPLTLAQKSKGKRAKREQERLKDKIKELEQLILEMVYFNLSFNSASSGGYSDHMTFLNELRQVHSIAALRQELKDNIKELGELIERIENKHRDEQEREFNRMISSFGSVAIPFGLLSGLYGMNNHIWEGGDGVIQAPFGLTFEGVVLISLIGAFGIGLWMRRRFDQ